MTLRVSDIWRHPVKGVGCETLEKVTLQKDRILPMDRIWAVLQEGVEFNDAAPEWMPKKAFCQGAKTQAFMAIRADFDADTGRLHLTHPERPDITVDMFNAPDALVAWLAPLVPDTLPRPVRVVKAGDAALGDQKNPYVSIISNASLAALSDVAGRPLEQERFRANIWLDGGRAWQEFDWIGRDIRIGTATLRVEARIGRCIATTANPATGRPDVETLALLRKHWGHKDLGVFARVIDGGTLALNDTMEVL